jgi:ribosomal protein S8E
VTPCEEGGTGGVGGGGHCGEQIRGEEEKRKRGGEKGKEERKKRKEGRKREEEKRKVEEKREKRKKNMRGEKGEMQARVILTFYHLNPPREAILPNVFQNGSNSTREATPPEKGIFSFSFIALLRSNI